MRSQHSVPEAFDGERPLPDVSRNDFMQHGLPHFKHGRSSKLLLLQIAAAYELARPDDDLLASSDEAAPVKTRIGDLLTPLEAGDAAARDESVWVEV